MKILIQKLMLFKQRKITKPSLITATLLLLTLCCIFYFSIRIAYENHKAVPIDGIIFYNAASSFNASGEMYKRSNEELGVIYKPGAFIYKFPPAFLLLTSPWINDIEAGIYITGSRFFIVLFYFISAGLIIRYLVKISETSLIDHKSSKYNFILAAVIPLLLFKPIFDIYGVVQIESFLFFVTTLSFLLSLNKSYISGFILSFLACIKIYPAFIVIYFLIHRDFKAVIGFSFGLIFFTLLAFIVYGYDENHFYFTQILPTLLAEDVTYMASNLNIESSLVVLGFSQVSGLFHTVSKYLFIVLMLISCYLCREKLERQRETTFSLVSLCMILYLPNYWERYQIFFIFPLLVIINRLSKYWQPKMLTLVVVIIFSLISDGLWVSIIFEHALATNGLNHEILQLDVLDILQAIGLYCIPLFIILCLLQLKPLVPVILLFMMIYKLHTSSDIQQLKITRVN